MKLSDLPLPAPPLNEKPPLIYTLIIGLAPAYECQPNQHCMGAFMRKLCDISGLRYNEYLSKFCRLNLFPDPIERFIQPSAQSAYDEASVLLAKILLFFRNTPGDPPSLRILCAGTICFHAMRSALMDMRHLIPRCMLVDVGFIPHPSGRNRMLNNPETCLQLARTLRAAAAESTPTPNSFYSFVHASISSAVLDTPLSSKSIVDGGEARTMDDGNKR